MRLIDADALKHEVFGSIPMMPTVRISIEHKIDAAPTIDAIPVEWLERKRKEALREGMRPDEVEAVEMVMWMWQKEHFVQTMKDWRRMCKNRKCSDCGLEEHCDADPSARKDEDIMSIEKEVTDWAAEHPEQVYPTWGEWLEIQDVVGVEGYFETEAGDLPIYRMRRDIWQPIPADIAEKLGIEPKEG